MKEKTEGELKKENIGGSPIPCLNRSTLSLLRSGKSLKKSILQKFKPFSIQQVKLKVQRTMYKKGEKLLKENPRFVKR